MDSHTNFSYEYQDAVIEQYTIWMNIIPLLTLPIYLEGAFCLFACSQKFQQQYVSVLAFHVSLSFVGECYGFFLMRPVVILPIVGLYSDGLLARLHVHTFIQVIVLFFLFQINACTMIHLLLLRFRTIIPRTFPYYTLITKLATVFIWTTYFSSAISLCNFALIYENQERAKAFWLRVTNGSVPDNFFTDNYIVASGENTKFKLFLCLCGCSLTVYTVVCILIPVAAFETLNKVKDKLSPRVVKAHKQYLKSVLVQVSVIVSFLLIPFATFIIGLEMRVKSPELVAGSITLAISHGAAATLAMIFANKPYRDIVISHFKCGCLVFSCLPNPKDDKATSSVVF